MDTIATTTEGSKPPTAPLTIATCDNTCREPWDSFLKNHPNGSFYHLFDWQQINEGYFGHNTYYLSASRGEVITGILPLVLLRSRLFGRILCSLPFVNFGGTVAADTGTEERLIGEAVSLCKNVEADYLEIRSPESLTADLPVSLHKVSMTVRLDGDPETLWSRFTSKHRTNIRRVYKHGIEVEAGGEELVNTFYQVLSESWRSMGTPIYRRSYFQEILKRFPNNTRIFVCRQNNRPIAVALNGEFNGTVEGMWLGSRPEARRLQASYALYWEMIKDACERGYTHFHLGRSTVESGGESFKKKWNAEARQLHWYYHLPHGGPLPQLKVDNPKYRLAIAAWRRMPLGITTFAGHWIARSIP